MSHILDHDDLHQTLTQLSSQRDVPASFAQRASAIAATRFAGRVSVAARNSRAELPPGLSAGPGGAPRRADKPGPVKGNRLSRLQSLHKRPASIAVVAPAKERHTAAKECCTAADPPASDGLEDAAAAAAIGISERLAGVAGGVESAAAGAPGGHGAEAGPCRKAAITVSGLLGGPGMEALLARDEADEGRGDSDRSGPPGMLAGAMLCCPVAPQSGPVCSRRHMLK